jgi:hypothetical protein
MKITFSQIVHPIPILDLIFKIFVTLPTFLILSSQQKYGLESQVITYCLKVRETNSVLVEVIHHHH